jgi:urease accessory protein
MAITTTGITTPPGITTTITTIPMSMTADPTPASPGRLAFLRLLQLASPALPVGAFAYSQGLEPAVSAGLVHDQASAGVWLLGLLAGPLAHLDLPVFARLHRAHTAGDRFGVARWNAFLLASRATSELQAEDRQLGAAFARVLATLDVPPDAGAVPATLAGQFARATVHYGVDLHTALETFAFMWAEAQTSAAVRLVPLGQSAGVRVLARTGAAIPAAVEQALLLGDDELGGAAPGLALLSTAHETQYSRLFRS